MKKKFLIALILATIVSSTLSTTAFAGPPPDADKGTAWNEGLENAFNHVADAYYKTGSAGAHWALAILDWLWYPGAGPPPWFARK